MNVGPTLFFWGRRIQKSSPCPFRLRFLGLGVVVLLHLRLNALRRGDEHVKRQHDAEQKPGPRERAARLKAPIEPATAEETDAERDDELDANGAVAADFLESAHQRLAYHAAMTQRARATFGVVAVLGLLVAEDARAQQPLPPLPPASGEPGSTAPATPPPASPPPSSPPAGAPLEAPPAAAPATPLAEEAPPVAYAQPAPAEPSEVPAPVDPTHAPKFSLWAGGSLGALGYGGYFYDNEQGKKESTGNFIGNGLAVELDVGVRLGKRYVPYVFIEHGFVAQGHRFAGSDATSASDMYGLGFRYTAGDVDSAGFLTELSVGIRTVSVSNAGQTYKMSAFEYFRLGLGAEIRISTLFVISPMAHLSGGAMDNTSGTVGFSADGSKDGIKEPTYRNNDNILTQRGYLIVGIGCGAHFDVFGK